MLVSFYTKTDYFQAFVLGLQKKPYNLPQGKWRPGFVQKLGLTEYFYSTDDLWFAYREGFRNRPVPQEKKI